MSNERKWELRPGGMVVQKCMIRLPPPPAIRVRVKYESVYHDIYISPQATFGELKKMLCGPTGLHYEDQKIFYKGKERESTAFLDKVGVKNKSKLILQEDSISQEKRCLEMQRIAKIEKSKKLISEITVTIDNLAAKVSGIESTISNARTVEEKDVTTLIELLMNQFLKLESIHAIDEDIKLLRKSQEQRVQKYVEMLDTMKLKINHSMQESHPSHRNVHLPVQPKMYPGGSTSSSVVQLPNGGFSTPIQVEKHSIVPSLMDSPRQENKLSDHGNSTTATAVITTQWESFDFALSSGASTSGISYPTPQPNVTWNLL